MSSLDLDTIQALLKESSTRAPRTPSEKSSTARKARPVQIGPLRWSEEIVRCASRGCGSPTPVSVNGVPRCTTHALSDLNYIILQNHPDYQDLVDTLSDCTCKAGRFQMMNIHTEDCALYDHIKEHGDSNKSTESSAS